MQARIRDRWAFLVEAGSGRRLELFVGRRVRVRSSRVRSRARVVVDIPARPTAPLPEKALDTATISISKIPAEFRD